MKSADEQFREMVGDMRPRLESVRRSVGEGRALMQEVLELAKGGISDIVAGNSEAVHRRKNRISEAIQAMKRIEKEWLRGQLVERAGSVLTRFAFVEAFFPCLFGEDKIPDLGVISNKRLGVSDQAWLWGIAGGPRELYDALRSARMNEGLAFETHVASLRRFLQASREAESVIASVAGSYPRDALCISGDRRDSLQGELRKLRDYISEREDELVKLLASTAPDQ